MDNADSLTAFFSYSPFFLCFVLKQSKEKKVDKMAGSDGHSSSLASSGEEAGAK